MREANPAGAPPRPAGGDPLAPLFEPITVLPGVGPRLAASLGRLVRPQAADGARALDLLFHLPSHALDRRPIEGVERAPTGGRVTLALRVDRHLPPPPGGRHPYRVRCWDGAHFVHLVFFKARQAYLSQILPEGETRLVSGLLTRYGVEWQIAHPDFIGAPAELERGGPLHPVYPSVQGLARNTLRRASRAALALVPGLPEWLDPGFRRSEGWPSFGEALARLHRPDEPDDLLPGSAPRRRLAYDELLASQLALGLVRSRDRRLPGRSLRGDGALRRRVLAALPFRLTGAQERVAGEIAADMARPRRMRRLLQGDVGSGKTVVALLAMLNAVEAGAQAALMGPTEILARQHAATLGRLLTPLGLPLDLLTGRETGRARARVLEGLASGRTRVAVGTHALFQEGVAWRDLALAVVDEQHRFGVHQRLNLVGKGADADLLVMTATPIPRTLVLTAYGDMDVSRLDEKPPGRAPVRTTALPRSRTDEVVRAVGRALEAGERLYWVCPLVEESEVTDLAAAERRYAQLRELFGARVGLVHGRMAGPDKDAAMAAFALGQTGLLVATSVIEVGVDVPEASVMVVEQAERFGLAQLHQLRGRVGRGARRSSCVLVYGTPLGGQARARLKILRETEDGFRIAEEDLRLRGPGEVLGTRQSGLPELRLAELGRDADLLAAAWDDVRLVLERDPRLEGPRGRALRLLLRLFERREAVAYLGAG
ncbi:MAG TPA: ATP-dependent DNA helicase RecG [Geminicoccaceae bacterium]|nr:ATP-dependent DNA helicase RecG [Geminicoccaceae bacterium]